MRSLIWWWRVNLPVLILHDRPCVPLVLTVAPHGHECASQRLSPRCNPTATRMVLPHIQRPHDEVGRAKSQSLLWVALRANNLALSRSVTQLFQIVDRSRPMPGASHEHCWVEHSLSGHEVSLEENQRAWAPWIALSNAWRAFQEDQGLELRRARWRRSQKGERASKEAHLILNRPFRIEKLAWVHWRSPSWELQIAEILSWRWSSWVPRRWWPSQGVHLGALKEDRRRIKASWAQMVLSPVIAAWSTPDFASTICSWAKTN